MQILIRKSGLLLFIIITLLKNTLYAEEISPKLNQYDYKHKILLHDMPLTEMIEEVSKSQFIAIGENHTEYSNHQKQLEIIKQIYAQKKNIAIGMEMFSAEYQKVLNNYLNGKITEYEFLKGSEYFNEWGYDYLLYKDIIDFARTNHIPVIGLNIENRIVRHIGRNGFRDMDSQDFNKIPEQIDFSLKNYKKSLYEIFQQHGNPGKSFDNFYLAQLVRDEQMSQTVFHFHKKSPEKTILILAGNGHIENRYGIPGRVERLTGKSCTTILLDSPFSPSAADYFVYTRTMEYVKSPQLNVMLRDEDDRVIISAAFNQPENENERLASKDEIISLDGIQVKSIGDIRLYLYLKKPGEQIEITLRREDKVITINYLPRNNEKKN